MWQLLYSSLLNPPPRRSKLTGVLGLLVVRASLKPDLDPAFEVPLSSL